MGVFSGQFTVLSFGGEGVGSWDRESLGEDCGNRTSAADAACEWAFCGTTEVVPSRAGEGLGWV
jgi:hypothetical protein